MQRVFVHSGLLLAVLAIPAVGASKPAKPMRRIEPADDRFKAVEDHLHQGEWDAAASSAEAAIAAYLRSDDRGRLADLMAYLALAEEGQGRHDDAVWHWREALNLGTVVDPRAAGAPGEALARVRLRSLGEAPPRPPGT